MSPEGHITELILNLGEVETLELIDLLDTSTDPPPFRKGEFTPSEVLDWVARNQDAVVPSILRVVDLGDEAIAYLHRLGVLPIGIISAEGVQIKFSAFAAPAEDQSSQSEPTFVLNDLAVTSAALCELAIEVAAANHSFGSTLSPLTISVQQGSIQYTVGGSLLASGVGLVVACGAGLVIAPIGFIGGGVLASAGLIDLALGWRKAVTENRKLGAEANKLTAEARKLEAEARKLELEAQDIESKGRGVYQYRSFAPSKLVPRDVVLREAKLLGLAEGYANHILNRALPKYDLIRHRLGRILKRE